MPEDLYKNLDDPLNHFCSLLMDGKIDEAFNWQKEKQLPLNEVIPNAVDAFNTLKGKNSHRAALQVGLAYQLEPELINPLYFAEYNRLLKNKEYEEAAIWAKEQGLSEFEMVRAAKLTFENYLLDGNINEALRVYNSYNIPKEELLKMTLKEYNNSFDRGNYLVSAKLGREFEFSDKRTLTAAMYAVEESIRKGDHRTCIEVSADFSLFSDDVFNTVDRDDAENFVKALVKRFIEPAFEEDRLKHISEFVKRTNVLSRPFDSVLIKGFKSGLLALAIKQHNQYFRENDVSKARYIRKNIDIYNSDVPTKFISSIVDEAIKYHSALLKKDFLKDAIEIKNEYNLNSKDITGTRFEDFAKEIAIYVLHSAKKQDLNSIKTIINEYDIPQSLINDSVFAALSHLLKAKNFTVIYDFLLHYNPDQKDPDVKKKLIDIYKLFMKSKEYILAADLASDLIFDKTYVINAGYKAWERLFSERKYKNAAEIRNLYKLPRKTTLSESEAEYWRLCRVNNYELAGKIRRAYRIHISVGQWLKELFNLLFAKKK